MRGQAFEVWQLEIRKIVSKLLMNSLIRPLVAEKNANVLLEAVALLPDKGEKPPATPD